MPRPRRRILCLDDDKDSCALLAVILGSDDYEVITVETIAEASTRLKDESFDLLVVDVILPDGSGIDFCREVRRGGCQAPILVHSAAAGKADIDAAMGAGANDYLVKPTGWEALPGTIQRLLHESRPGCDDPAP